MTNLRRLSARLNVSAISSCGVPLYSDDEQRTAVAYAVKLSFGKDGNERHNLGVGWSGAEVGMRWAVGASSDIWLNNPGPVVDLIMEVDVDPFLHLPGTRSQRLEVCLRGSSLGKVSVRRPTTLGFLIQKELLTESGPLRLEFYHPDAASPLALRGSGDDRFLAIAFRELRVQQLTLTSGLVRRKLGPVRGLTDPTYAPALERIVAAFESMGDNCEFGLIQRRFDIEQIGLLRFAFIELCDLISGLKSGFVGVDALELVAGSGSEIAVRNRRYHLNLHTFEHSGNIDESEFLKKQVKRAQFLRRKFLEDLSESSKIFVCKRNTAISVPEILPAFAAIREYGPNTLLFVVPADDDNPSGSVQWVCPGLLIGFIERFAPHENAHDSVLEGWLSICFNSYLLRSVEKSFLEKSFKGDPTQIDAFLDIESSGRLYQADAPLVLDLVEHGRALARYDEPASQGPKHFRDALFAEALNELNSKIEESVRAMASDQEAAAWQW